MDGPNFFILGAAKSGTTSLYKYLEQHEEVYFPVAKEPQFFSNEDEYSKGHEYYINKFYKGCGKCSARGDATPHYLYYEKVAKRLSDDLPEENKRLIVILRDPVFRAYSLYWNMVYEGYEELSFEDALVAESARIESGEAELLGSVRYQYFESGLYAKQINNYLKYFEKENILILFQDDLKDRPQEVMDEVFYFLGVEKKRVATTSSHNKSGVSRSKFFQKFLRGDNKLKHIAGKILPHKFKYKIIELLLTVNKKEVKYTKISVSTEESLRRRFLSDIEDLERLTKKDLSVWKL